MKVQIHFTPPGQGAVAGWNQVINTDAFPRALTDDADAASPLSMVFFPTFQGINLNGATGTGLYPDAITSIAQFGQSSASGGNAKFSVDISGFDNAKTYKLTMYASRAGVGDNREARYNVGGTIIGDGPWSGGVSADLNAANNTTLTVSLTGIAPSAGHIVLNGSKGPSNNNASGFFYLGVIIIEEEAAAFTAPTLAQQSSTASSVTLGAVAGVGGTQFRLHRSTTMGFTPSSGTAISAYAAFASVLTDSTVATDGTIYAYVYEANDGSTSLYSNQVIAAPTFEAVAPALLFSSGTPIVIGYAGSSTWEPVREVPEQINEQMGSSYPTATITTVNDAVGGTTALNWSVNGYFQTLLDDMMAVTGALRVFRYMIGSNDSGASHSVAQWRGWMVDMLDRQFAADPNSVAILEEIGFRYDVGDAAINLLIGYNAERQAISNLYPAGKVRVSSLHTMADQVIHLELFDPDHIHQTGPASTPGTGSARLAQRQALEIPERGLNFNFDPAFDLAWDPANP